MLHNTLHPKLVNRPNRCGRWLGGPVALALAGWMLASGLERASANPPTLQIEPSSPGKVSLSLAGPETNSLWQLEFSTDLQNWTTLRDWTKQAGLEGTPLQWEDPAPSGPVRFYRTRSVSTNWDAPVRVWGVAMLVEPLVGATVTVQDLEGNLLAQQANATSDFGVFDLTVPALPSAFQLLIQGGTSGNQIFTGTLRRTVANYQGQDYLVVNPVSTLMALYQGLHPGLAPAQAQADVNRYLMAPAGEDVVSELSYSDWRYFNPNFYAAEAADAGGFDAFTAQLATAITPGTTNCFVPLQGTEASFFLKFLKNGFKHVASAAFDSLLDKGMDSLLGLIFGSEQAETMEKLQQIKDQIGEVQSQLGEVSVNVRQIQNDLYNISGVLKLIQWDHAIGMIYDPACAIEGTHEQYHSLALDAQSNPTNSFVLQDANNYASVSGPILNASSGVYKSMSLMNDVITGGGTLGGTPLLEMRVTNLTANLTVTVDNRWQAYLALQDFYANLLGVQLKGLDLVVQAYNGKGQTNSANSYLVSFYTTSLVPQAQLFEHTVEEVVLMYNDTRWAEFRPEPGSSLMLVPAYQFVDALRNAYRVNTNGLAGTNDVTMITVALGYNGAPPTLDSVTLTNTTTGQLLVVPYEATTSVTTDSGPLSLLRFHLEEIPSGIYRLALVGTNAAANLIPKAYASTETIVDAQDTNRLYGALCIPTWMPFDSQIGQSGARSYSLVAPPNGVTITNWLALTFTGPSTNDLTRVQQWDKTGWDSQKWLPTRDWSHPPYEVWTWRNKYSAGLWTDDGASRSATVNCFWWKKYGFSDNAWSRIGADFILSVVAHNSLNGMAISVETGSNAGPYGWWQEEDAGGGYKYLKNTGSGKYLEVADATTKQEAHLQALFWVATDNQKWMFVYADDGYYAIVNTFGNMVMDLWGGNGAEGAEIKSFPWCTTTNQMWRIDPLGGGFYRLINRGTGKAVSMEGASIQDGARAGSWSWNNGPQQRWQLIRAN